MLKHKHDIFIQAEKIKQIVKAKLGSDLRGEEILHHLCRIKNHHYDKKKTRRINDSEQELLKTFLSYGYCPLTVYQWVRLTLVPEDLKQRIAEGKLTTYQAVHAFKAAQDRRLANQGLLILEEGRKAISRL